MSHSGARLEGGGGDFIYARNHTTRNQLRKPDMELSSTEQQTANKVVPCWRINQFNLDFSTNKTTRNTVFLILIYIPCSI